MKTTLVIDDRIMSTLEALAASEGKTMSELVEAALRLYLQARADSPKLPELPGFSGGGTHVNVSDRNELYRTMDQPSVWTQWTPNPGSVVCLETVDL